jgi:hypothetical protein
MIQAPEERARRTARAYADVERRFAPAHIAEAFETVYRRAVWHHGEARRRALPAPLAPSAR